MFRKSLAHLPSLSSFSKPIPKHEESTSDSFNDVDQENVMEESTFPMLPRTPSSKKSQSSTTVLGMSSHPNQQPHTPAPSKLMPVKQAPGSNRKSLVAEAYQRPETIPEICDIVSTDFQIWAKSKKSEWEEEHQLFLKSLDDALSNSFIITWNRLSITPFLFRASRISSIRDWQKEKRRGWLECE